MSIEASLPMLLAILGVKCGRVMYLLQLRLFA